MPNLDRRLRRTLDTLRGRDPAPRRDCSPLLASLLSGLVALMSGWIAIGLRGQLRDLRSQRAGAARPYLTMRGAIAIRGEHWLGVTLENIGTGPAVDISVEGRLIEEPDDWPRVPRWYANQMVRAAFANDEDRPHPVGDLHAIPPGQVGTVWFYGAWPSSEDRAGVIYFLGVHVTYYDLFGNRIEAGRDGEHWSGITFPEE